MAEVRCQAYVNQNGAVLSVTAGAPTDATKAATEAQWGHAGTWVELRGEAPGAPSSTDVLLREWRMSARGSTWECLRLDALLGGIVAELKRLRGSAST